MTSEVTKADSRSRTIAVTGATGQLGRLVVDGLIETVPTDRVVAVVRDEHKATRLHVPTRVAAYEDLDALTIAFDGVDVLVFVSANVPGIRVPLHTNVVRAAQQAGVDRVVYTSAPHADDTTLIIAPEHRATEELLRGSGLTWTFLRNNWYSENFAGLLHEAAATGAVVSAAGDGRVASASRPDFAAAAVTVATSTGHGRTVYELGGDTAWNFAEFTQVASQALGQPLVYRPVTSTELDAELTRAGVDDGTRGFRGGMDISFAEGTLSEINGQLSRLIGRPTTPLIDTFQSLV